LNGSDEFFTELAYLECNRLGIDLDMVRIKRDMLEKRFTHLMVLVYHPELDAFTVNILTHSKNIKSSFEIQTIFLADTDLVGDPKRQYLVASEFVQIPRIVLEQYIREGKLKIDFKLHNVGALNYVLQHDLASELNKIAKNNLQKMQISIQFICEGCFDTKSPSLSTSSLKVSQLEGKNMLTIHYPNTEESFIISEKLKKINITKPVKKINKFCGLVCTLI
jgi:hypothetical protein